MRKIIMLILILIFTVLCAPHIRGQKYWVTDSSCPVEQTGYSTYVIRAAMSQTSNSIKCKLPLRPATTSSMYALVKILNINCATKLKRPISAYTSLESFKIDCGSTQQLYQTFKVNSNDRIDFEFPASSYDYQLRMSVLVMYYSASSKCSSYDIPCTASGVYCVSPSNICDGIKSCPSSQDEPAVCEASNNQAPSTVSTSTPSNVVEVVVNWFMADPSLRITIAVVAAVCMFFVLPTIIFCCCGKKKRKPPPRSSRGSSRSRSAHDRDANIPVAAQANPSRRGGRPSGRGSTRQASGSRSGTSQQNASNRYEPIRSEPSAPPPPLSSAPPMPSAPLVLLPAGQIANQPLYAVPFAQQGGQPAYFSHSIVGAPGGPEQPQYVTAYMLQQDGTTVPLLLGGTAGQPPQPLLLAGQPPVSATPITSTQETCAPPTYDEAIRAPAPASPTATIGQPLTTPFACGVQLQTPLSSSTTTNQPVGSAVHVQTRFMPGSELTQPNLNQLQPNNPNASPLDTAASSNPKAMELVRNETAHEAEVNLLPTSTSDDQRSRTDCEAEQDEDSTSSTNQQVGNRNFENQLD